MKQSKLLRETLNNIANAHANLLKSRKDLEAFYRGASLSEMCVNGNLALHIHLVGSLGASHMRDLSAIFKGGAREECGGVVELY